MVWQRSSSLGLDTTTSTSRIRGRGESDVEKEAFFRPPPNTDDDYDHDHAIEHDSPSVASSRSTSDMYKSMLGNKAHNSSRSSPSNFAGNLPRSIMRWLCLGVAATLLIFIFSLVRLSWNADKEVKVAIEQEKIKPKPPPWETFPFLERYYGGLRALVPSSSNVPEYPRTDDEMPQDSFNISEELRESEAARANQKRELQSSKLFDPYPNYTSPEYITQYGSKVDCFLDSANTISIPKVRIYEGVPRGFPDVVMGSAQMLGLRNDVCYDRFGRLGPYGLGYSLNRGGSGAQLEGEREGADLVWSESPEVDWRGVQWLEVQKRCLASNKHRFEELPVPKSRHFAKRDEGEVDTGLTEEPSDPQSVPLKKPNQSKQEPTEAPTEEESDPESVPLEKPGPSKQEPAEEASDPESAPLKKPSQSKQEPTSGVEKLPRTALIIRTWWDYPYTPEDKIYLRSLISELVMMSGGEYEVHFLIQVKDNELNIFSDEETYDRVLRDALPEEFRGMGTLWNERQMHLMYGGLEETNIRNLPVHGVYRSTFMPMQYFAYRHPEYDFFWNWEMDIRTTHHWYHLFDSVTKWAKAQPRKLLWERNSRFYIPTEHGSWEDFSQMVRIQTEHGTNSVNNLWSSLNRDKDPSVPGGVKQQGDRPIWGPERPLDDDVAFEGDPEPPTSFDKDKYTWGVGEDADLITFNPLFDPDGTTWLLTEDTTGYNKTRGQPPRRTAIITASRLSKKLLLTMHRETAVKRHTMFSEMWPASCALHHGLKVVYAPHPEYVDRKWPTNYLQSVLNAGRNGATGGSRTSVFGDREHNFRGMTWYYNAGFPEVLWHRWLGMRFHNAGGEQEEMAGEGRMCLPGMLLHPVKRVDLVLESRRADQSG